jgi:hypothetical protein
MVHRVGGAERAPHDLENLLIGHSVPTGTSPFRKIAETFSLADPQPPGANGPKPGIDDGVQHAAEELEQSATAAAAAQLPESTADGVSSYSLPDMSAEANNLSSDGGAREDHDIRHQIECPDAQPTPALEIRTEDVSHPAQEKAQYKSDSDCGETDAADPQASSPLKFGLAVEPDSPQESASQEEGLETGGHQESAERVSPENSPKACVSAPNFDPAIGVQR